jgi:8-oxo-dGTP diphosphatase
MPREIRLIEVVVGLLKRGQQLLVGQRPADKPYSGYWEFPGGKIEQGETGFTALKRELQEELNIQVLAASFCFSHQHSYPDKTVLLQLWRVDDFLGEPKACEHQELRWISVEELAALNILEGNRVIVDKIIAA